MLWVLKRIISFFWEPKTYVETDLQFYAKNFCLSKPVLSFGMGSENHKCFIHIMIFQ